jgi:predicted regulator of Ras-like GTPase activity (Roadblock/LC7/MglB family)
MQQQQQDVPGVAGTGVITADGVVLQPLIPATAAGLVAAAPEGGVAELPLLHNDLDSATVWPQHPQLHSTGDDAAAAASLLPPMYVSAGTANAGAAAAAACGADGLLAHAMLTAHSSAAAAMAAAAAAAADVAAQQVPEVLTLKDTQLQQLYHQVTLHTQLLTQLYVLTARYAW